ncbi:hypothetical protein Tco_0632994, partial [Tanacetum coccineum]
DLLNLVAYETVYKEWEDRMERAATTASSLDAEQDSGSGPRCHVTILGDADAQTRIEAASKYSNNLPLSRGYTLGSGEDSMKLLELMELCTKLSDLEKKAEGSSRKKSIGRKRAKDKQEQESSKRQRVEDDKEEKELKKCFELAKEEEIAINAIPLATKVPVVGFQIHTRGKPGYYEIFRADGSLKLYHAQRKKLKGCYGVELRSNVLTPDGRKCRKGDPNKDTRWLLANPPTPNNNHKHAEQEASSRLVE